MWARQDRRRWDIMGAAPERAPRAASTRFTGGRAAAATRQTVAAMDVAGVPQAEAAAAVGSADGGVHARCAGDGQMASTAFLDGYHQRRGTATLDGTGEQVTWLWEQEQGFARTRVRPTHRADRMVNLGPDRATAQVQQRL